MFVLFRNQAFVGLGASLLLAISPAASAAGDMALLDTLLENGTITQEEFAASQAARFTDADENADGQLTEAELIAHLTEMRSNGKARRIERMASRMLGKFVSGQRGVGSSPLERLSDRELEVFELII